MRPAWPAAWKPERPAQRCAGLSITGLQIAMTRSAHRLYSANADRIACFPRPQTRSPSPIGVRMNTPGTPKPSSRQRRYLLIALVVFVAVFVVTLFIRW